MDLLIHASERHRAFLVLTILAILVAVAVLLSACQSRTPQAVSAQLVSAPAATFQASEITLTFTTTVESRIDPAAAPSATATPTPTGTATAAPTATVPPAPTATEPAPSASDTDSQAAPLLQAPSNASPQGGASSGAPDEGAPRRIVIPRIGVDARIVVVGILSNGEMGVPNGPDDVAWYGDGPVPGQPGNALLGGHLDWGTRGAVFWRLRDLRQDDHIQIEGSDGSVATFAVTDSNVYPAHDAPVDEIFASRSEPMITLITCEGIFNRATHDYSHRRVVTASMVQ